MSDSTANLELPFRGIVFEDEVYLNKNDLVAYAKEKVDAEIIGYPSVAAWIEDFEIEVTGPAPGFRAWGRSLFLKENWRFGGRREANG